MEDIKSVFISNMERLQKAATDTPILKQYHYIIYQRGNGKFTESIGLPSKIFGIVESLREDFENGVSQRITYMSSKIMSPDYKSLNSEETKLFGEVLKEGLLKKQRMQEDEEWEILQKY